MKTIRRDKRYLFGQDDYLSAIIDDRSPEKLLQEVEVQEQVKAVFSSYINDTAQVVMINKYYYGMSYSDMAQEMNTSANALKVTKSRAINKLKEESENNPVLKQYISFLLIQTA